MNKQFADDLKARFSEFLAHSPAKDLERNAKEFLRSTLTRMDIVTREEFQAQCELAAQLRARVDALEARLSAIEGSAAPTRPDVAK